MSVNERLQSEIEQLRRTLTQSSGQIAQVTPSLVKAAGSVQELLGNSPQQIDKKMVNSLTVARQRVAEATAAVAHAKQSVGQLRSQM